MLSAIVSVFVGGWGGLNQIRIRKILAYSSISHLGWIIAALFFVPSISLTLFILYILTKTMIFLLCHKKKLYYLSKLRKTKIIPFTSSLFSITLLSLGGLPPLSGFINKLIPSIIFIKNLKGFIAPLFLFRSLISLYFYLRIVFKTRLILFPNKRIKILLINTKASKTIKNFIRRIFPLILWGLPLLPFFILFI